MLTLGIETSCDETAVALYDTQDGLLDQQIYSQIAIHAEYGGVVPELASRDHIRKLLPLIKKCIAQTGRNLQLIDGIAYTKGPGLIGALMVGACVGRSLGWALQKPTIGVHHLESHLMAVMLEQSKPDYPFVALLVSGGHTMLILVRDFGNYELMGESVDDAAGEAFDKTAKLLGLTYPGGPALANLAEHGDPQRFHFPRPMIKQSGLNFSFSGLKTHAVHCLMQNVHDTTLFADIARAFEDAIVDTLVIKSLRALEEVGLNTLVVVGGVGANKTLRESLRKKIVEQGGEIYYPRQEFCTDNAAMVAYTGAQRLQLGEKDGLAIEAKARWSLQELSVRP